MRRRALLSSLAAASAAAVAGCQTTASGDTTTTDRTTTTDHTTTAEPPDDDSSGEWPGRTATTVSLETQPRTLSLFPHSYRSRDGGRVSVSFEATATADHPARLRVTLANENDFPNTFRLDDHPPFGRPPYFYPEDPNPRDASGVSDDARSVFLAPRPMQSLPLASPEVERGPGGVWRLASEPTNEWLPATYRLDAGESVSVAFDVVGDAGRRGLFPELRYRKRIEDDYSLTLASWNPAHPGPHGDSRFDGRDFPPLSTPGGVSQATAWFHEAGPEAEVYLRPSSERLDLPATATFSLVNRAGKPATGNPYYWSLYKFAEGDWHKITPWVYPMPLSAVPPGGVKTYRLRAAHGDALPCRNGKTVGYLGGGTYAFEVGMSTGERRHAAAFDVEAPPVEVTPLENATTTRDGDTVTVTTPEWTEGDGKTVVTVSRADTADTLLVPELAARREVFRNTLPFFESGVATVKLRTGHAVTRFLGEHGPRFRFRGQAYEASVREPSE